jgi:AcrR family transcriptional regulator
MTLTDWFNFPSYLQELEQQGKVSRTFKRLDSARQQAVLNSILEESAIKGPASLNIKEIARRADVSIGSLYQYFSNREGLLNFAIDLCTRYMTDMFTLSLPYLKDMPLREALRSYLSVGLEWGRTENGLVRFYGRAAYLGDPDLAERLVRPVAEAMRKITYEMLAHAAKRGEIRSDVDLEAASRLVNGLMIVVGDSQLFPYLNTYFQISDEQLPPDRITEALIDFILKGLN